MKLFISIFLAILAAAGVLIGGNAYLNNRKALAAQELAAATAIVQKEIDAARIFAAKTGQWMIENGNILESTLPEADASIDALLIALEKKPKEVRLNPKHLESIITSHEVIIDYAGKKWPSKDWPGKHAMRVSKLKSYL